MKSQIVKYIPLMALALFALMYTPPVDLNVAEGNGLVVIGDKAFEVEIADTKEERSQGLMNRESLPQDSGMLFIFDDYSLHAFWMKNTLIPLDIVWIADDEIVYILHDAQPSTAFLPSSYVPDTVANYVLEVNGGIASQNGWQKGTKVQIHLP